MGYLDKEKREIWSKKGSVKSALKRCEKKIDVLINKALKMETDTLLLLDKERFNDECKFLQSESFKLLESVEESKTKLNGLLYLVDIVEKSLLKNNADPKHVTTLNNLYEVNEITDRYKALESKVNDFEEGILSYCVKLEKRSNKLNKKIKGVNKVIG